MNEHELCLNYSRFSFVVAFLPCEYINNQSISINMKIKMAFSRPFTLWVVRQPLHSEQTQGPAGSEHVRYSAVATQHPQVHIFTCYGTHYHIVTVKTSIHLLLIKPFCSMADKSNKLMTQHGYGNTNSYLQYNMW